MEKLRVGDDNNDELGSGEASSSSASLALNDPRRYLPMRVIGSGSFGVVYQARDKVTNEIVAIKKVLEDSRFKNRELQIMQELSHPNTVQMRASFVLSGKKHGETYLNLVLEYVPEALYNVLRHYLKARSHMPAYIIKVYLYQVARSLAYIHSLGICHRDIKPQNLLLDPQTHVLKLCDFGSAKRLIEGEPNISYICSRYYRAPELIFGSTSYTFSIDIWSLGCVFGEMLLGSPLFPGTSGVDQLVEIIKVLGTPTREQIRTMNSNYSEFKFPQIRAHSWDQVLRGRADEQALDLISKMLQYSPAERPTAVEMLAHPYFDELRTAKSFPNGKPLPPLMDFTEDGALPLQPGQQRTSLE